MAVLPRTWESWAAAGGEVLAHLGRPAYAAFDVVVLAASSGGLKAYRQIVPRLPADFPAAVILLQHRLPRAEHLLSQVLQRDTQLQLRLAQEGEPLAAGVIQVAAAGRQLLVTPDKKLSYAQPGGEAVRCAADPLFASAAAAYGRRTLAVVLSGALDDGAGGIRSVKRAGGRILAQTPASCDAPGMPTAAIATGMVDFVLPAHAIADALVALVMVPGSADFFKVPVPYWARLDGDVYPAQPSAFARATQGMALASQLAAHGRS
jgi:two-component system, chemotaxis family, protein-glutamate methylesterase/glutaminase